MTVQRIGRITPAVDEVSARAAAAKPAPPRGRPRRAGPAGRRGRDRGSAHGASSRPARRPRRWSSQSTDEFLEPPLQWRRQLRLDAVPPGQPQQQVDLRVGAQHDRRGQLAVRVPAGLEAERHRGQVLGGRGLSLPGLGQLGAEQRQRAPAPDRARCRPGSRRSSIQLQRPRRADRPPGSGAATAGPCSRCSCGLGRSTATGTARPDRASGLAGRVRAQAVSIASRPAQRHRVAERGRPARRHRRRHRGRPRRPAARPRTRLAR